MWCENGAPLYIPVCISLIIPTGRLIAFCHDTRFWPGQGVFIVHNDDGKITGHMFVSHTSVHSFNIF